MTPIPTDVFLDRQVLPMRELHDSHHRGGRATDPLPTTATNGAWLSAAGQLIAVEAPSVEAQRVRSAREADASRRRELADRITEDSLQLLFTAHQDLAELQARGPSIDGDLLQSAQECTLGAISVLRVVAAAVREPGPTSGPWDATASALFDAVTDAWVVTCEASDLLFASETACALLGRTTAELSALMREKGGWPRTIRKIPLETGASGETHFDLDVPLENGETRPIHVQSHALPLVKGVRRSYISLLTRRDA